MNKKILCAFFTVLLLVGCKDPRFGETFRDFAFNDAPKISRDYANATLDARWEKSFYVYINLNISEIDFISSVLNDFENYIEEDLEQQSELELLSAFVNLKQQEELTVQLRQRLLALEKANKEIQNTCDSQKTFYELGLNHLVLRDAFSMTGLNITSPVHYSINSDMDFYQNSLQVGIDFMVDLFTRRSVRRQKEYFDEGQRALERNLIKDEELFEMSSNYCSRYQEHYSDSLFEIKGALADLDTLLRSHYDNIQAQLRLVGSHLVPRRVERILTETGIDEVLNYYHYVRSYSELSRQITYVSQMIYEAQSTMPNAASDFRSYRTLEDYLEQLTSLQKEIAIIKNSKIWEKEVTLMRRVEISQMMIERELQRISEILK